MSLPDEIVQRFKDFKTFTFSDVRTALKRERQNISDKTIQVTLSRMTGKSRIFAVTKGVYTTQRRDEFAGFAFAPFYYGGLAALMIRDLIDDQVKMEVMTTRRVKRSFASVFGGGSKIVLHHLPKKYYFGFQDFKYGDTMVPVSDPEKTLIDLFYYKIKLSLRDYAPLLKSIKMSRLVDYLSPYDSHTAKAVLNFVREYKQAADLDKLTEDELYSKVATKILNEHAQRRKL